MDSATYWLTVNIIFRTMLLNVLIMFVSILYSFKV